MYKLDSLLSESLNRYYDTLKYTGYVKYKNVYQLLVSSLILDILEGEFGEIISEKDYKTMDNVLHCFYGSSCLIPYPTYKQNMVISKEYMNDSHKLSEDGNIRISESGINRLVLL